MARKSSLSGASPRRTSSSAADMSGISKNESTDSKSGATASRGPFTGRAAKSCNLCRKMKQKCDAVERFPESCSRCHRRNVQCEFDGSRIRNSWLPGKMVNHSASKSGAEAAAAIMMLMNGYVVNEGGASSGVSSGANTGSTNTNATAPVNTSYNEKKENKESAQHRDHHNHQKQHHHQHFSGSSDHSQLNSQSNGSLASVDGPAFSEYKGPEATQNSGQPPTGQNNSGSVHGSESAQRSFQSSLSASPASSFSSSKALPFEKNLEQIPDWVTWPQLETMYWHYIEKCHPYFPIVPNEMLVPGSVLFATHRLLFWAFVCIGSVVDHQDLSGKLQEHCQTLISSRMGSTFMDPVGELAHAASMMVLSYWPTYSSIRKTQISSVWGYCGQSSHIALSLGVNCPLTGNDYSLIHHDMRLRGLLWLGCLVNVQSNAMLNGFPSTVSNSWSNIHCNIASVVCDANNSVPTPDFASTNHVIEFIKQSRLLSIYSRASAAFCEHPDQPYGLLAPEARGAIYKSFYNELSDAIAEMSPLSPMTQLISMCCKFYMHCLLLLPNTLEPDLGSVLIPIYVISVQLTKTAVDMVESGVHYLSFPSVVVRTLVFASMLLYKILSTPYKTSLDEATCLDSIKKTFRFVIELLAMHGLSTPPSVQAADRTDNRPCDKRCWLATLMYCTQKMYATNQISSSICHVATRRGASAYYSMLHEVVYWRYTHNMTHPNVRLLIQQGHKYVYSPKTGGVEPLHAAMYQNSNSNSNSNPNDSNGFSDSNASHSPNSSDDTLATSVMDVSADLGDNSTVAGKTLFTDDFWVDDPDMATFLASELWN